MGSQERRFNFYTESTLRKLLGKPKDPLATEYENNIDYKIDCSYCKNSRL